MEWVTPPSLGILLQWWIDWSFKPKGKLIWDCIPTTIPWTIWNTRNGCAFKNETSDRKEVVELIKSKIALWVKAKWKSNEYSLNDFIFRLRSILEASHITMIP
ncbi:hypothetical protein RHGRI_028525 [Rhododendron griersonianum]|uniref:Uncharacterized protein n=1 Tax=Rhododendron griersonianum TaxID=479676 RepID=A0AAV6IM21_9ERIC|nr:hypothetical protein RHGRI_028525 [Rhododendron griersonianum]